MSCFAVKNYCKSAKHPWAVSEWLPESSVGVCLAVQTAFWNEIPWKSRLCCDYKKMAGLFFPQCINRLRQADGEIMEPERNAKSLTDFAVLSGVLISSFIDICLSSSSQPVLNSTMSLSVLNLPEPFHSEVWFSLTDRVLAFDAPVRNSHRSHQSGGAITWPHRQHWHSALRLSMQSTLSCSISI